MGSPACVILYSNDDKLQMVCLFKTGNRRPNPNKGICENAPLLSVVGSSLNILRVSGAITKATAAMADALANIPVVEIDPEGTFKYILVRVKVKDGDVHKDIVRGTKSAEYHSKLIAVVCCSRGAPSASVQLVTRTPAPELLLTRPMSFLVQPVNVL